MMNTEIRSRGYSRKEATALLSERLRAFEIAATLSSMAELLKSVATTSTNSLELNEAITKILSNCHEELLRTR